MGIGDEIMVTGRARVMQQSDPRKVYVTYRMKPRWHAIWDGNPRLAKPGERGDFQRLQARDDHTNMRPYHHAKLDTRWVYNLDFRAEVGEIYLSEQEREFGDKHAGAVILEPHIKSNASPNKQWGWMRWEKLAWMLNKEGVRVSQFEVAGQALLDRAAPIPTPTFRLAAAVLARAQVFALPEGGLHHAAAAFNTPGVVIFGGFTPVELTGYSMHHNLGSSLDEACGMRIPCEHCSQVMSAITPETIFDKMMEVLNESKRVGDTERVREVHTVAEESVHRSESS